MVAVIHPGDNSRDHSRLGTLSNLYGRPIQISEAITATLGDPMLSPFVNANQVGVIGYSAGGETALILSGATRTWIVCADTARSARTTAMRATPRAN